MLMFFVDTAYAMAPPPQGAGGEAQNPIMSLIPFVLIMVVFYFLFFRPQQKKAKEHAALVAGVAKGDEVVTSGGIMGKVTASAEDAVTVETTPGVKLRVQRQAIVSVKKGEGGE